MGNKGTYKKPKPGRCIMILRDMSVAVRRAFKAKCVMLNIHMNAKIEALMRQWVQEKEIEQQRTKEKK